MKFKHSSGPQSEAQAIPTMQDTRSPTGRDVARLAGVSQSSVSRVLRPGGSASARVRAKVLKAAASLGYRPNYLASALATRRTSVIAVVLAGATTIYYPEVLRELCTAITAAGCRAMVYLVDDAISEASAVDALVSYRVDAAVTLVSLTPDHVALLGQHGIRLVLYNREGATHGSNVVTCDHRASGQAVAKHLLALGHRTCAIIAGPPQSWVSSERIAGIVSARAADGANLEVIAQISGDFSYDSGVIAMNSLGHDAFQYSTIIACNDAMAAAAVDVVRHSWRRLVPQDVSIIGFDGTSFAGWSAYRLTTIVQPVRRLCEAAVEILTSDHKVGWEQREFKALLSENATTGPAR